MVLNNVTKCHKFLIKTIQLSERTSLGVTYGPTYRRTDSPTGLTLNALATVMSGGIIRETLQNNSRVITTKLLISQLLIALEY